MILSLVAEGRTVVLSSHLLDEVDGPVTPWPSSTVARSSARVRSRTCWPGRRRARDRMLRAGSSVRPPRPHQQRGQHRRSASGPRHHAAGRDQTGRDRRDQPTPGRGRDLGLPTPGSTNLARILVPGGHQPTGSLGVTTVADQGAPAPNQLPIAADDWRDRRGSWIPTGSLIATRFMELRKRRGLMVTLIVVTIGIPTIFLAIRLLLHAVAPKSYGPAGGYDIFNALVAGVLYVFGFIVAATLGCTAGSVDLTEGMFRHLVVTGRSRLALYLARIPAGLAIIGPLVAIGFTVVCAVCVFAAPTQINYSGVNVPAGLSRPGLENWAKDHADVVVCNFNTGVPRTPFRAATVPAAARARRRSRRRHRQRSAGSSEPHPTDTIDAARASRPDRRPGLLRLQQDLPLPTDLGHDQDRVVDRAGGGHRVHRRSRARLAARPANGVGDPDDRPRGRPDPDPLAGQHPPPDQPAAFRRWPGRRPSGTCGAQFRVRWRRRAGGDRGTSLLVPEPRTAAVCVVIAWLVGWTVIGAWRMATRDA